jgi:hypothetical protein
METFRVNLEIKEKLYIRDLNPLFLWLTEKIELEYGIII